MSETRLIGLYPSCRGWTFAVLERSFGLVDFGFARAAAPASWPAKALQLARKFDVDAVAIEDLAESRRGQRARERLESVRRLATDGGIRIVVVAWKSSKMEGRLATKWETAQRLAGRYPELLRRLPRKRRPWMSEDARMNLFGAVAIAERGLALLCEERVMKAFRRRQP